MSKQDLELRVYQIAASGEQDRTSVIAAIKQALGERFNGPKQFDELLKAYTALYIKTNDALIKNLAKSTINLPEPLQGSFGFFDNIPPIIWVNSDEGPMFVSKDVATTGEVREWDRIALQHHSVQHLRFQRLTKELEVIEDIDSSVPWTDSKEILKNRLKKAIEEKAS